MTTLPTWPTTDAEQASFADWQSEVANGDTIRGFRDWLPENTPLTPPSELDPTKEPVRTVYVLSWAFGDDTSIGGGGFNWFPGDTDFATVAGAFDKELANWADQPHRVRLMHIPVPAAADGQTLTDLLDDDSDFIEVTGPALMDHNTLPF